MGGNNLVLIIINNLHLSLYPLSRGTVQNLSLQVDGGINGQFFGLPIKQLPVGFDSPGDLIQGRYRVVLPLLSQEDDLIDISATIAVIADGSIVSFIAHSFYHPVEDIIIWGIDGITEISGFLPVTVYVALRDKYIIPAHRVMALRAEIQLIGSAVDEDPF